MHLSVAHVGGEPQLPPGFEALRGVGVLASLTAKQMLSSLKRNARANAGIPAPLRDELAVDLVASETTPRLVVAHACADPPIAGTDETLVTYLRRRILRGGGFAVDSAPAALVDGLVAF